MSYDLHAFKFDAARNPEEILEEIAVRSGSAHMRPDESAKTQPLVHTLLVAQVGLQVRSLNGWPVELGSDAFDVLLFPEQATISIPYAPRKRPELIRTLDAVVTALRGATGWNVWDPQREKIVVSRELDDLVDAFEAGVAVTSDLAETIESQESGEEA